MDLLGGVKVQVASYGPAAAYAGWLLQRFGATLHHETNLDPEGLGAFLAPGATVAAAPSLEPGLAALFVTDAPPTPDNRRALARWPAESTVAWITPWGIDGPWTGRPATDLVLHAAGGWMAGVGEPDGEPLGPPGAQGQFVAGLFAAVELLAALALEPPQRPRLLSIPAVEAIAATMIYDPVAFQYYDRVRARAGNRYAVTQPSIMTMPCADGYVGIHAALHSQWVTLCSVIGHPALAADPRFASTLARTENLAEFDRDYLLPWLMARTRFEIFHELQNARIPCSPLPTMQEVLASEQLEARRSWEDVSTPAGHRLRVPGAPARVVAETRGAASVPRADGPWRHGAIRVVDLSMGWAGPLVSHLLACHGADVIKVESHRRFDWWRGSRPPGDDPDSVLHERSHVFNTVNRGKRGLTLDLTTPRGRELLCDLASQADVLVENFGAGVMEKLGLPYEQLSGSNPGLIMLRQPAFGSTGPHAGYVGFGNTIEGMSGLSGLTGHPGGPPYMLSNALGDPVSGLNGAVAVLAALLARTYDSRGRCIEAAQVEGMLPLVSEELIREQLHGPQGFLGNHRPGHEPSGLVRCHGDDAWVALEVRDDAEWASLAEQIGEAWARAPRYATLAGRAEHRSELAGLLGDWAQTRAPAEVVELCARAGVPAAPVNHEPELLFDAPLVDSGFFVGEERDVVGFHLYPSLPVVADGARSLPGRPAPLLGQHNREILVALGLDGPEIEALRLDGVIGERPPADSPVADAVEGR